MASSQADNSTEQAYGHSKQCDLCEGSEFETIARTDRRGKPLETVVCTTCGLVAHGQIPTEQKLDQYYASYYRRDYHGEITPSARRVVRAWRNGQRICRQVGPWLNPNDTVFEIGAGIGCTVKAFELAGFDASGNEPGIDFQKFSREELKADVTCQRLFEVPPGPRADAVLLVHVIEHFRSPRQALEHIHRILRPGGRLYVECPNLAAPFARRAKLFHFAHIHNFTPTTLAMLGRRCGFDVECQFSDANDPNLQVLFTRVDKGQLCVDSRAYEETRDALQRYNSVTYHLRASYLWPRVKKLYGYLREHISAERELKAILARCRRHESADLARVPLRKAI